MKNVGEMGLMQWSELSVALKKAGFTPDMIQDIISSKHNMLAEKIYATMKGLNTYRTSTGWSGKEEIFRVMKEFWVTIPDFYVANTWLKEFFEKYKKENYDEFFISNKNYPNPAQKIIPGKTYRVEIVSFLEFGKQMYPQDCFDIFKQKNVLLFGLHGLSLVHYLKKDKFKDTSTILCPDEKKHFLYDKPWDIPALAYHPNERASLNLVPYDKFLSHYTTFLLFYEN